ncbi:MAG: DUF4345 family protein [Myxococcales bacterium]|nr:DUF4345 family protein [Myxococcales bacterium]
MALQIFLVLSALIWLPYGIYCFFVPESLAGSAGLGAMTATGTTELRAMYGGLQAAIGVMAAIAVFRESLRRPALVSLAFLTLGLGAGRLLGLALDGEVTSYTGGAVVFEFASAAAAIWFHSREVAAPSIQPRAS